MHTHQVVFIRCIALFPHPLQSVLRVPFHQLPVLQRRCARLYHAPCRLGVLHQLSTSVSLILGLDKPQWNVVDDLTIHGRRQLSGTRCWQQWIDRHPVNNLALQQPPIERFCWRLNCYRCSSQTFKVAVKLLSQ